MNLEELSPEVLGIISDLTLKWPNLFGLETLDGFFVFRPATKGEFSDLSRISQSLGEEVEDELFDICVVYPVLTDDEKGKLYAGTVTAVANNVATISGFGDEEVFLSLLEESRTSMKMADNQMMIVILKAFPYLTFEDINKLDVKQFTYRLALAEEITGTTLTIQKQEKPKKNGGHINFDEENKKMFGRAKVSANDFT